MTGICLCIACVRNTGCWLALQISPREHQEKDFPCIAHRATPPSGRIGLCPLLAQGLLAVGNWLRYIPRRARNTGQQA